MKKTKSAGGVVVNSKGKILVVEQHGTSWSLPKGQIEQGEKPVETAKREIYEEAGIKNLKYVKNLGNYSRYQLDAAGNINENVHKTIFIFLFKTNQNDLKPIDTMNPQAKWINKNEVSKLLTHPKDKKFFLSIIKRI